VGARAKGHDSRPADRFSQVGCYQAAGLLIDGVTVVVSRSIALQKDQVNSVTAQPHTASTAFVNSWLSATTVREKLDALTSGEL
jgi:superfamily II DNA helicase RecQ